MKLKILCIFSAFVLLSCSPTRRFVTPEYDKKIIPGATLAVMKINAGQMLIENADDVSDDLGKGNATEVFITFFEKQLPNAIQTHSNFQKIILLDLPENNKLDRHTFPLEGKETISIEIPKDGDTIQFEGAKADFVLFMDFLTVSRFAGEAATMMPGANGTMTMTGGKAPGLDYSTAFVIWDNHKGKVVAYGRALPRASFMFAMTKDTWISGVNELAREFVEKGPFFKPLGYTTK